MNHEALPVSTSQIGHRKGSFPTTTYLQFLTLDEGGALIPEDNES